MTATEHVHVPDATHGILRIEICRCGYERRIWPAVADWTKPRTTDGILRAAQWEGK